MAIGRLQAGQTESAVAGALGVSQSVISRLWNRFLETGNVRKISGQGCIRATTHNEDRYLTQTARRNRSMNGTLLQTTPSEDYWYQSFESNCYKPTTSCWFVFH
ncbi:hypothetical protein AVEN_230161-1 [Araneus ventricosus]|uniref:Paired domain-containing protein n=1 Tax=Araneus ventricosus TaxID=182803 RepID=A0A4Y2B7N9_ARAVE|nr:hypothetical protein AVEN_212292-1 [Araneus ventricosus]GBL87082.1 hypothetical protein AVEN_164691-1 [Araneus ventricosus]GBL87786.1 hypothetical protein AVEN_190171-1 [Araneus ventricosus]GBL87807.1 hypothetical protein AVEN_230161-1 [Araneus ventricosus]